MQGFDNGAGLKVNASPTKTVLVFLGQDPSSKAGLWYYRFIGVQRDSTLLNRNIASGTFDIGFYLKDPTNTKVAADGSKLTAWDAIRDGAFIGVILDAGNLLGGKNPGDTAEVVANAVPVIIGTGGTIGCPQPVGTLKPIVVSAGHNRLYECGMAEQYGPSVLAQKKWTVKWYPYDVLNGVLTTDGNVTTITGSQCELFSLSNPVDYLSSPDVTGKQAVGDSSVGSIPFGSVFPGFYFPAEITFEDC